MSLTAALNIGRSALATSSLGIQVAGNNMANAATPGYTRQVARLTPLRGDAASWNIGSGVGVSAVQRQIDDGLEARLRLGTADAASANVTSQLYSQIEDALGELGDHDLSSELSAFFTSWSERANQSPSGAAVIQQGQKLAQFMRRLRSDLVDQRTQADAQLGSAVTRANQLLTTIADLNRQVSEGEAGGPPANALRDQRDQAVSELAQFMNISVIDRGQQGYDILAGSTPVVLGAQSRGLALTRTTVNGELHVAVTTTADNAELQIESGRLGGLLSGRGEAVNRTIEKLDTMSSRLIFEVNKLHSTGASARGLSGATGTLVMPLADRTRALNDPANQTMAALPFQPANGSFLVRVKNTASGAEQEIRINVDLDGITSAGTPGTTDDTSLDSLRASLAGVPGLSASVTADGKLDVRAADGYSFTFGEDTSGVLAVLGVNSFFQGSDASDVSVRSDLLSDSTLLTAGRIVNGALVENGTALRIAGLSTAALDSLGGATLQETWRDAVQQVGADSAAASSKAQAASVVQESLQNQRAALSGVSIDEESVSLLDFQRQYQAAARLISVVQELTDTLIQLA